MATAAVTAVLVTLTPASTASAADPWDPYGEGLSNTVADLDYPVFVNGDQAVPDTGLDIDPSTSYLREVFDADVAEGAGSRPGQDFWVDEMLSRDGAPPDEPGGLSFNTSQPENINYDNNAVLFSRGRALYMEDSTAGLGFQGDVAYIESLGNRSAYTLTLTLTVGGQTVTLTEDTAKRHNTPSYWSGEFTGSGLRVVQAKFIDAENVLAEWVSISTTDGSTRDVTLTAASPFTDRAEGDELRGSVTTPHNVTRVETRLSGDGFTASGNQLTRTVQAGSTGTDVKVQMGFLTTEIPAAGQAYDRIRAAAPQAAYAAQTTSYNEWWVENVPYLETPSPELDKSAFYRWWLLRTNYLDANVSGNDFQFPTAIEGVFGQAYNNAIVLTTGMFVDDLKYFRDPASSYGSWLSAGEVARHQAFIDNPGNPVNWNANYSNYIAESAWESYQVHGGDSSIAEQIADYARDDVTGQLARFDSNDNGLIEYTSPAWPGNDTDAVSFSWRGPDPWHSTAMDRPESAYVYAGAMSAAEAYELAGDTAAAAEMRAQAEQIKASVLDVLWEDQRTTPDEAGLFGNLVKASYAASDYGAVAGEQIPWKEVNMYYPYTVGLMPQPGDADFDPKYLESFRLFVDEAQYSPFPFYTANQVDAQARAERDPGRVYSNNFSTINSTVMFRLLSSTIRDYPNHYLTSEYYKNLLYWNAWASYEEGDVTRQNENEFWAHGSTEDGGSIQYRSWIHQTQLGTTNFTLIEDAMGLQTRADDLIEVSPIDIDWDHFAANNIRYHDQDLSIVWDAPGGEDHYEAAPEGYSVYLDGELAFTLDSLQPAVYDPSTGEVTTEAGVTTSTTSTLASADDVRFDSDDRVVDLMALAGVDIDPATSEAPDLATGRPVTASYSAGGNTPSGKPLAPAGAVDGSTVNEPFWGTAGSPDESDWIQIDLGEPTAVDEAQVHFYRSSSSTTVPGYAAPSRYAVQYQDATGAWVSVANQARTPVTPQGNLNTVNFEEVTAQQFRVLAYHAPGARTGVKEVRLRDTGAEYTPATNAAPVVSLDRDAAEGSPRVRFTGNVTDDGLPSGALTSSWTVVSTPSDDARVSNTNPTSPSTVLTFSEKGDYRLEFTATDGESTTTVPVSVTVSGDLPPGPDISGTSQATASHTAAWNRLAALADGRVVSATDPAQTELWGTYRDGARPAQDTVTQTWASPQRVSGVSAWFWNDTAPGTGTGVALPQSWRVEHLAADGSWRPVDATTYPTSPRGQESRVGFTPVETTALRVVFTASPGNGNNAAIALSELDVFTTAVDEVEPIALRTAAGTPATLPATAVAVYADGRRVTVPVDWEAVDASRYSVPGQLVVNGTLAGSATAVTATVSVGASSNDIASLQPATARTYVGSAPDLPRTVVAVFAGGSGAQESRPVVWDAVDAARYAQEGTFDIAGTVAGTAVRALVTVTVEQNPDGVAPAAPEGLRADVAGTDVTVSWTAPAADSGVTSHEVVLTSLAGGTPVVRTVPADARQVVFTGTAVGEYTVALRAQGEKLFSPVVSAPVGVVARPGAPVATVAPAAADGAAGWYVTAPTVQVRPSAGALAGTAAPAAAYTAPWNTLAALADGRVSYTGATNPVWGTWSPDRPASRTVEYRWATPKVLTGSTAHFWSDTTAASPGDGVGLPAGWSLQQLDAAGQWVDVEGASAYPVAAGQPNTVAFPAVTTTGLRMVLQARGNGTSFAGLALSEWTVEGWDAGTRVQQLREGTWTAVTDGAVTLDGAPGPQELRTRSVASSGLVSEETTTTVQVDRVAPVSSASTNPAGGSVPEGTTVTVTFAATDAGSGVDRVEYSTDAGTTWQPATAAGVGFTAVGPHVVQYRAVDTAGNVEAAKQVTVTVTAPQSAAATVAITSADQPSDAGWYQQDVLVRLTPPVAGQRVQYQVNGGAWRTVTSSITVSRNGTTVIGHRVLSSNVVVAGSEAETVVKLDKVAPTAAVTRTPTSGTITPRNPLSAVFAATDAQSGVTRVEYRVNQGDWQAATADPVVFDRVGDFVVTYRATDAAGNTSTAKAFTLTVKEDVPTRVTTSSSRVAPGAAVTLSLTGHARWDDVAVTVGGVEVAQVLTDVNGAARVTVRVPATAPDGATTVVTTGTTTTAQVVITVRR
ncbi:Ig-like domain-containing protein [Modestobacter sp. Leaf380]|uniref:OmpL47-type beta-barrel domain-containing protein n=1 Tax=Modestobacter sp. Leaf380 TaxID=1736356 RepID=UPI0006FC2967|nr:Ig-like domain-containing protein [Modestobacter sp. Leaf380]KQS66702.1 hypothetical protein ASG41_09665 [Modestobacter sp. Leaf380]